MVAEMTLEEVEERTAREYQATLLIMIDLLNDGRHPPEERIKNALGYLDSSSHWPDGTLCPSAGFIPTGEVCACCGAAAQP